MNKTATQLRNQLFEKYFEVQDGIELSKLMQAIKPITNTWKQLFELLKQNVEDFDIFDNIEIIRQIENQGNQYLMIKFRIWKYLILDLKTKQILNKDEVVSLFSVDFFIEHFAEVATKKKNYTVFYHFFEYSGNIYDLIDFYMQEQKTLNLPNKVSYRINIGKAYTYLSVNLTNGYVQLRFQTPSQSLYEFLHLDADLMPWGMQDAQSRIGVEKMNEMFERIKSVKIPITCIPDELYQALLLPNQAQDSISPDIQKQKCMQ